MLRLQSTSSLVCTVEKHTGHPADYVADWQTVPTNGRQCSIADLLKPAVVDFVDQQGMR